MCTQSELTTITNELVRKYRHLYGDALREVLLYGSYARGDYDEESDVDVAAIVDQPRETLSASFHLLAEAASELSLAHGLTVSPTVIPLSDYTRYREALPYYRNLSSEGVRLDA